MKVISARAMKRIDVQATRRFAIPSLILMENAGRSAAEVALRMNRSAKKRIIIICGYGNNGGDGFVVARHLLNWGRLVNVVLVGKRRRCSSEFEINLEILKKLKCRIQTVQSVNDVRRIPRNSIGLIVDALFGIGLHGELNELCQNIITWMNAQKKPVLSLDIPSGLSADTGVSLPVAVMADTTITFGIVKKGLLRKSAKPFVGKLARGDISLPKQLAER